MQSIVLKEIIQQCAEKIGKVGPQAKTKISIVKIQCYRKILEVITEIWRKLKKRAKERGSIKSLL